MKYLRLLKLVLLFSSLCTASGFVFGYFLDYGFSTEGLTTELLLIHGFNSLKSGLLVGGLYAGFPIWLALEHFPRRKTSTNP